MFRLFPFWRCVFLSQGAQTNYSRFDRPENIFSSVSWVHYIQAIYSKDKCTIACVVWEEERSVLVSVALIKGITGFKELRKKPRVTCANYWQRVLYMKGPTMWQNLERKISFLCLFVCLFIFAIGISGFILSAFFLPHFPIRIRDPQVSGPCMFYRHPSWHC